MICVATLLATNSKWKGKPVHRVAIAKSKRIKDERGCSMREALILLKETLQKRVAKSDLEMTPENYGKILKETLEGDI